MLRLTENTSARLMLIHGYTMLALGIGLFFVRATMTNVLFYIVGGAFAMLLVAASLLFVAGVDWVCAAGFGCHQVSRLRGFLLLSTAVAGSSVLLVFYPGATMQMLCYVLAAYAFFLGTGKFILARSWNGTKRQQTIMYILAGIALAFSASLVVLSGRDDRVSLAVIASYSVFIGLQMLLTMYFLEQRLSEAGAPEGLFSKFSHV